MIATVLAVTIVGSGAPQSEVLAVADSAQWMVSADETLGRAFFVGDGRVVYLSGSQVHSADVHGRSKTIPVGSHVRLVDRDDRGRFYVYDLATDTIALYQAEGTLAGHIPVPFRPLEAEVVGVLPDGSLMSMRRLNGMPSMPGLAPAGTRRDSVVFELHGTKGDSGASGGTQVADALGGQFMWLTIRYGVMSATTREPIVFGHRLLFGRAGETLVIALTDTEEVLVYTRDGQVTARRPIPGHRRHVSEEQIAAEREFRVTSLNDGSSNAEISDMIDLFRQLGSKLPVEVDQKGIAREVDRLPANVIAPPIDRLIVDFERRVWVRSSPMPEDASVLWFVWSAMDSRVQFTVCLSRNHEVLDARDNRVLIRARGLDGGGNRLEVRKMGGVAEHPCAVTPDRGLRQERQIVQS